MKFRIINDAERRKLYQVLTMSYVSMLPMEIKDGLVIPAITNAPTVIGTMSAKIILAFLAFFICMRYVNVI